MTTIADDLLARHRESYPGSTIDANELQFLQHISRWGSDGYPVAKRGRSWWFDRMFNAGGCPSPFKTKRAAFEFVENYCSILRDKYAGRAPGTGDRQT